MFFVRACRATYIKKQKNRSDNEDGKCYLKCELVLLKGLVFFNDL
jgi:hypothetical protein